MVLAELYEKDTDEFLCIIMCNSKEQLEYVLDQVKFEVDVEIEAVNYGLRMVLQ